MPITRAEAFAPASMGNVGIGFDVLGLAYEEPGDRVVAVLRDEPGAILTYIEGDNGRLSLEPDENCATIAANALLKTLNADHGVALTLYKGLPLASGLGSSAASSVAAVVAVNALLGKPLSQPALLPAAMEGEASVSGYHADNIAPCLLGGILLIAAPTADQIRSLPVPDKMHFALVTPDVAVPTAEARTVLPQQVPIKAMVRQTVGVAQIIDALYRDDIEAAAAAMESDQVIEPARAHLMPLLAEVRTAAKANGAFGVAISGAGPTLCAICDSQTNAQSAAAAMHAVYANAAIDSTSYTTKVSQTGAQVLDITTTTESPL